MKDKLTSNVNLSFWIELDWKKKHIERKRLESQHQLKYEEKGKLHAVSKHKRRIGVSQTFASEKSHKTALIATHVIKNHQFVKGWSFRYFIKLKTIAIVISNILEDVKKLKTGMSVTGVSP